MPDKRGTDNRGSTVPIFIVFVVTQPGIESESTASAADALSTGIALCCAYNLLRIS